MRSRSGRGWAKVPGKDGYAFTSPVGTFRQNSLGLCDMGGNAWQWCEDEYGPYQLDQRNPNQSHWYVVRGGYWGSPSIRCRSASREAGGAANKWYGFRVALSVGSGNR